MLDTRMTTEDSAPLPLTLAEPLLGVAGVWAVSDAERQLSAELLPQLRVSDAAEPLLVRLHHADATLRAVRRVVRENLDLFEPAIQSPQAPSLWALLIGLVDLLIPLARAARAADRH